MTEHQQGPTPNEELEREAQRWDASLVAASGWRDAPHAIPRAGASTLISIRMPNEMLAILKELALREGIGYQVLVKRWLDERIRKERKSLSTRRAAS